MNIQEKQCYCSHPLQREKHWGKTNRNECCHCCLALVISQPHINYAEFTQHRHFLKASMCIVEFVVTSLSHQVELQRKLAKTLNTKCFSCSGPLFMQLPAFFISMFQLKHVQWKTWEVGFLKKKVFPQIPNLQLSFSVCLCCTVCGSIHWVFHWLQWLPGKLTDT